MSVMPTTRLDLPRAELVLLHVAPVAQTQRILSVEFGSADGRSWKAIGGGDTLTAAIEWARESCPHGTIWEPVGWEDLHGE
jgi:xanthine/CO dehydrogenase XdhC/CoxF family maturation factor